MAVDAARAALAAMPVVLDIADRNIMLAVAFSAFFYFELINQTFRAPLGAPMTHDFKRLE